MKKIQQLTFSKESYSTPEIDIVYFLNADIITTSTGGNEDDLPID